MFSFQIELHESMMPLLFPSICVPSSLFFGKISPKSEIQKNQNQNQVNFEFSNHQKQEEK
jgi:hypothetical protein